MIARNDMVRDLQTIEDLFCEVELFIRTIFSDIARYDRESEVGMGIDISNGYAEVLLACVPANMGITEPGEADLRGGRKATDAGQTQSGEKHNAWPTSNHRFSPLSRAAEGLLQENSV
jgi:hypothetical protein